MAGFATRPSFAGHTGSSAKTNHELTSTLDHQMGAGHPDACPTTLFELTTRLKELGPEADRLNVVFITVDPERDTPQQLALYLSSFDPHITGLSGTPENSCRQDRLSCLCTQGPPRGWRVHDGSHGNDLHDELQGAIRRPHELSGAGSHARAKLRRLLDFEATS